MKAKDFSHVTSRSERRERALAEPPRKENGGDGMKKKGAPEGAIGKSWEVLRRFDELVQSSSKAVVQQQESSRKGVCAATLVRRISIVKQQ